MAVARPQVGGGSTGLKVALVVFVCLTVASLTFAIILFTGQEDLRAAVATATKKAKQADDTERQMRQQLEDIARFVIGEPTSEVAQIKQEIKTILTPIFKDERVKQANIPEDSTVMTAVQGLYGALLADADALQKMTAERDGLSGKLAEQTQTAQAAQKQFSDKAQELLTQFLELEKKGTANQDAWKKQVAQLTDDLEKAREGAGVQLDAERAKVKQQQGELDTRQARIDELVETLASFRPSADRMSLLQIKDGNVTHAVAGEDIVYIDLGRDDGIKPGMTFAVYSKVRGIPADGKGKANLTVVNVFEANAECRATSTTKGDPILGGDIVANPVYDRFRKLTFAVAGDFDLDFDDKIDDAGGQQVVRPMIERWGGRVVEKIDTRTDFIVLGSDPALTLIEAKGQDAGKQEPSAKLKAARRAFEIAKNEARALSIPVLTRTQFLHFVGHGVSRNVPDDQPAL